MTQEEKGVGYGLVNHDQHEPIQGPRPGDHILRIKRKKKEVRFRRVLGTGGLYALAYGDVGSSIYYALGITAYYALGATPIALAIAGVFFYFTACTYAEGGTMLRESGGSCAFARRAVNNFFGYISGWALLLVYIVTMSLSALSAAYYLAHFYPSLKASPYAAFSVASGIILLLGILNFFGVKEASSLNVLMIFFDLLLETLLVVVGFIFFFNFKRFLGYIDWSGSATWPSWKQFPYAIAVGMVGYVGIETIAQQIDETISPERTIPRAGFYTVATVLFYFVALPIVALSAMSPQELKNKWLEDPIAGIAHHLPIWKMQAESISFSIDLQAIFSFAVSILAVIILIVATNAALMAFSRLSFSMTGMGFFPKKLHTLHRRFRTPYLTILLAVLTGVLVLVPAVAIQKFVLVLGDFYRFGAMLAFFLAHASILILRYREPDLKRPYRAPWNFRVLHREFSLTAILGFLSTFAVWITVILYSPWARYAGFGWLLLGIVIYYPMSMKGRRRGEEKSLG